MVQSCGGEQLVHHVGAANEIVLAALEDQGFGRQLRDIIDLAPGEGAHALSGGGQTGADTAHAEIDDLKAIGIQIKDTKDGTEWTLE